MSRRLGVAALIFVLSCLLVSGCSEDSTAPVNDTSGNGGLVQINIDPAGGTFAYPVDLSCRGEMVAGGVVIRGSNIHYDDGIGALVADLTVTNHTRCPFPEPVWLTFVQLLPEGVTVLNPDSGQGGVGSAIVFEFANDDGQWTPLEESLPRTVQFGVDPGQGVGFVARIDVGTITKLGTIAGLVWHDKNEDGVIDADEPGIGGHWIKMERTDGPEVVWATQTGNDGSYQFDGLPAGHYVVTKEPLPGCRLTTPETIHVLLVEYNGEVSSFLDANFGCVPLVNPNIIAVGDGVKVSGMHTSDPHVITAVVIDVYKCRWPGDGSDPGVVQPPCIMPLGELMGPVTDINLQRRALAVMGTWVVFDTIPNDTVPVWSKDDCCPPLDLEDVEIGDRVRVRALRLMTISHDLIGIGLWEWPEKDDRAHGMVEQIVIMPPPLYPSEIMVLGTRVAITGLTRINFHW